MYQHATNCFIFTATYEYRTGRNYCFQTLIFLKEVFVPVNNATYMGQCWVVIYHKRGDLFTLILSIRFNTIQIFTVGNITKFIESIINYFTVIASS